MTVVRMRHWASEAFLLAGASRDELTAAVAGLRRLVERHPDAALVDLAAAADAQRPSGGARLAVVAATREDLEARLAEVARRLADPECTRIRDRAGVYFAAETGAAGGVAFLFPGEASQYPGMLADVCLHVPAAREWFDVLDRASLGTDRPPLSRLVFGPTAGDGLWAMDAGAESVTAADLALLEVVRQMGVAPQAVAGHSTGDWAALLAGGILHLDERDELAGHVAALNACYRQLRDDGALPDAALLAVGAPDPGAVTGVVEAAAGGLAIAMDNCPHQIVLCGDDDAVGQARRALEERGAVCQPLPFGRAYHTPRFDRFSEGIRGFLSGLPLGAPQLAVYSCATASPYPDDPAAIREIMAAQWREPVRFRETVEAMYAAGCRTFVEIGPSGFLTAFVRDTLRRRPHLAVAMDDPRRPGTDQLSHAAAQLAVHGVDVDLAALRAGRAHPLDGPRPASRVRVATALPLLHVDPRPPGVPGNGRPATFPEVPAVPAPADPPPTTPPAAAPAPVDPPPTTPPASAPAPPGGAHQVVEAYLATMERFLATQRDVMRAYLTGGPGAEPPSADAPPPVLAEAAPGAPDVAAAPAPAPAPATNGAAAPAPAPAPATNGAAADPAALVRRLIADRTGYPPEMLDRPLDLEADLGIDSIKRVEILAALQQETGATIDMERAGAVRTLDQIVELLPREAAEPAHAGATPAASGPDAVPDPAPAPALLGQVARSADGRRLTADRRLDLARDPYLRDHCLGGPVSATDPDLLGLPVLPLTMTVELMAEAAAALAPREHVASVERVRGHHWIALDGEETLLHIEAVRADEGAQVEVHVHEGGTCAAEAIVHLAPGPAPAPPPDAGPAGPGPSGPSPWPPDELYRHGMFHGPAFRGVAELTGIDAQAITGRLRGLPADTVPSRGLILDPVLLDAAGQLIGFWAAAQMGRGFTVFPFEIEEVRVHGEALEAGADVEARAAVAYDGGADLTADIRLTAPDGGLHAVLRGWRDLRFRLPERFFDLRLDPSATFLGDALEPAATGLPADGTAAAVLVEELPDAFLLAHGQIWMRVLAHLILGRRERAVWRDLVGSDRRRADWLRGRAAAKDAVRTLLRHRGIEAFPADVEILPGAHGAPIVHPAWPGAQGEPPVVSITHSGEVAIGAAANPAYRGVGIDVEHPRTLPEGFAETALAPDERRFDDDGDARLLTLWCMKESAAKAVGHGLGGDPHRVRVRAFDAATGTADVDVGRLTGATGAATVRAHAARAGELTIATAVRERSPS
ncbi:type I polyketide synthase [Capillimicrobium parvum]|uniref:type I polyketide synthase n=1 Tax=Capillimicrobium parvum TaxID=2884022 RepID=UPI00216AF7CD|nr:acyltransferase domain-containing protein [Capillimicrobium parvum]